jgi:hypothetical protein
MQVRLSAQRALANPAFFIVSSRTGMYTTLVKQRPLLPTIATVYHPLEQYLNLSAPKGFPRPEPAYPLTPLDAYLIYLIIAVHPGAPILIDFATAASRGMSTLLGLRHPRLRCVFLPPGFSSNCHLFLDHFLRNQCSALARLETLPSDHSLPYLLLESDVVLLFDARSAKPDDLLAHLHFWLAGSLNPLLLVLGLGRVGECPHIKSLLTAFPSGSPRRFSLLRDLSGTLTASGLAVVADRANPVAHGLLARLQELFITNYSILDLLRSATDGENHSDRTDPTAMPSHCQFLDWNEEINELKHRSRQAWEEADMCEAQLRAIRAALPYRFLARLGILSARRRARRAAEIWRTKGILALARTIGRRLLAR